jgi:hypothetical protein
VPSTDHSLPGALAAVVRTSFDRTRYLVYLDRDTDPWQFEVAAMHGNIYACGNILACGRVTFTNNTCAAQDDTQTDSQTDS